MHKRKEFICEFEKRDSLKSSIKLQIVKLNERSSNST